jgi:hypothetical protein
MSDNIVYQNPEILEPIFFLRDDFKKIATINELADQPLNRDIYFNPTSRLKVSRSDSRLGSCFTGWQIPTSGIMVESTDGWVSAIKEFEHELSLNEYKERLDIRVKNCIQQIYDENRQVYLTFSGGIDSVVVLSYIMHMGLGSRTHLVCSKNLATTHPKSLAYDQTRIQRMEDFFIAYQSRVASTCWITQDTGNIVDMVNRGRNYLDILNYTTVGIFETYQDTAWLGGYYGNATLLHNWVFLDQLRIKDPSKLIELEIALTSRQNTYQVDVMQPGKFSGPPIHIKYCTLAVKPCQALQGINQNRIYTPLGSQDIFDDLRKINPADFDFDTLADARFGRELIHRYAPDLSSILTHQTPYDNDNIVQIQVPTKNLNYNQLYIPESLNHHPHGIDWLTAEIASSKDTGYINMNTLVSFKNLQYIVDLINISATPGSSDVGSN